MNGFQPKIFSMKVLFVFQYILQQLLGELVMNVVYLSFGNSLRGEL